MQQGAAAVVTDSREAYARLRREHPSLGRLWWSMGDARWRRVAAVVWGIRSASWR